MKEQTPTTEATRQFCSSCYRERPTEGGALVLCANGSKRWKCVTCLAKSRPTKPAKKK